MLQHLSSSFKIALSCLVVLYLAVSCSNNSSIQPGTTALTDASIAITAKTTAGFVWYKKSDALMTKGANSGHPEPFLRTRYNATAAAQLDANGKVKTGAIFDEGSVIVKELIASDRTTITTYAVLIKQKSDPNADASGWVWNELTGAGAVAYPISNKGAGCIPCHSIAGNIDKTLMNNDHP